MWTRKMRIEYLEHVRKSNYVPPQPALPLHLPPIVRCKKPKKLQEQHCNLEKSIMVAKPPAICRKQFVKPNRKVVASSVLSVANHRKSLKFE